MNERIDDPFLGLLAKLYWHVKDVVEKILILSQGNTCVKSGVSINDQMLEANMKEYYQLSRRIVYEGVSKEGGILKVNIWNEMLLDVRQSWRFDKAAVSENKEHQNCNKGGEEKKEKLKKFAMLQLKRLH